LITDYHVRGYKSLRDIRIQPAALNVLVGANACGKSSFLQSLLLLRQSCLNGTDVSTLQLSGELFEGGIVRDVLHPEARSGVAISIAADDFLSTALFAPELLQEGDSRQLVAAPPLRIPFALSDHSGDHFSYLNAERLGPRVVYPLPRPSSNLSGAVGMHGEFTTAFLARCMQSGRAAHGDWFSLLRRASERMPEDLLLDDGSKKDLLRLDLVAKQVLSWVIPGVDYQTTEQSPIDSAQLSYVRDPGGTKTLVRPTHMGFGVSYTIPVIAAALAIRDAGILIVENPEAHLHPSSQSRIGIFLALVAAQGAQVFIETHSDHVVNGIRLAAKNQLVDADNVKFFYFSNASNGDDSSVQEISVSPKGTLSQWPEGFFDQIERDLSQL
jgi:predicted ATPase